jgi:hypothetical protein
VQRLFGFRAVFLSSFGNEATQFGLARSLHKLILVSYHI